MAKERLEKQIVTIHATSSMAVELLTMPDAICAKKWNEFLNSWMTKTKGPFVNES